MRFRVAAAAALVALVAVTLALVAGSSRVGSVSARAGSEHQGLAFQRHQEEVFSKQGDSEGPASYADQVYELNAFPNSDISPAQIASAQAAGAAVRSRGVGKGKNSTASWFSLGPTDAVYPAFLNRHGSRYVTSGRITALAISPTCTPARCTVWVGAAGGGVWRTDKALAGNASWVNVSDGFFASGAIGSLTFDAAHNTLYAGTGEDAAAGDAEAGLGVYKSTDGGDTWTALAGNANFMNRSIRQIAIDQNDPTGNTIYVADGRGVHGISSTTAGAVSGIPGGQPGVGVWKSTDGGSTFTLLQPIVVTGAGTQFPSSFGSTRGATDVALDPTHPGIVYAAAYNVGVWRSTDNGATWTNIHACSVDPIAKPTPAVPVSGTCGAAADRSEFALVTLPNGDTRMYQTEGDSGPPTVKNSKGVDIVLGDQRYSRLFIANGVQSGSPTFVDKTSAGMITHTDADGDVTVDPASPGYATYNFCTGQCWYDQGVYSPAGSPNTVYVFGSFVYAEANGVSNARGVLLSQDGGETFTDLTEDAGSPSAPNGIHPDQHALVTIPGQPLAFFEGSDGGLMRSDGTLADTSSRCDSRDLSGSALARCKQLLSAVPGSLVSLNSGLQTLQFQSLSVNPANAKNIQGGTQDNGTFETSGSSVMWPQTIFGDGGLSGFDATDPHFRFHTYFGQQVDVSFEDGKPPSWDWVSDPLFAESSLFYFPLIT
ncbi:MAG TPA: sialidase family protein, partial [Gaiellaceae bacterium]|nr:sialidase family protein [Gaiellaceae bacterium]